MEETLTDCMVRVKEDLGRLQKVRDYLQNNAETEEDSSFTWRTIEVFDSILSIFSSQNTPETSALDTLLDSFYYLARNNTDKSVWDNFGFELGIICVKLLSAIERTDIFEDLFSKLMSIISIICKHNSGIWKASAKQILNLVINRKFSLCYLEDILKSYKLIIRNVESFVLSDFSLQNICLLKMLSFLVQRVGDYEIQSDIVEIIFLHLSNDTKLMSDFFTTTENKFFHSFQFSDFEGDCRLFLNALNKQGRESERKIYSICCRVLYFGGCFVKPPIGRNCIWMDANKDTEKISFKCTDAASDENRVIHIRFSDLVNVHFDNEVTEGGGRLIIQTKSLEGTHKNLRSDDIRLVTENADELLEFFNFLEAVIGERKKKKHGSKVSKTVDCLFIDIRSSEGIQDSAVTSSNRYGVDQIFPDAFFLPEKVNKITGNENKGSQPLKEESSQKRTPSHSPRALEVQKKVFGSRVLSTNSFAGNMDQRLDLDRLEVSHTFEDSLRTVEFLQKGTLEKSNQLFLGVDKIFNTSEENSSKQSFTFSFNKDKENQSPDRGAKQKIRAHGGNSGNLQTAPLTPDSLISRSAHDLSQIEVEAKLTSPQSQDFFRENSNKVMKKKPSLPKLGRMKKSTNNKITKEENKDCPGLIGKINGKIFRQKNEPTKQGRHENKTRSKRWKPEIRGLKEERKFKRKIEVKEQPAGPAEKLPSHGGVKKETQIPKSSIRKAKVPRRKESGRQQTEPRMQGKPKVRESMMHKDIGREKAQIPETKPSLLDPNGYAFKRWCNPTTSERSNFWLKKLNALQKTKTNSDIFEFSDDLDSGTCKPVKKKKTLRTNRPLRPAVTKRLQSPSLRQAQEFLKASTERENSPLSPQRGSAELPGSPWSFPRDEGSAGPGGSPNLFHSDFTSKRGSTQKNAVDEGSSDEPIPGSDEERTLRSKKRDHSDEGSYTSKGCLKKKSKTTFSGQIFISVLRHRLQKVEERDSRHADRVMQTVSETTDLFFDRLQKKGGERAGGCLEAAEAAASDAEAEMEDLKLREKRTLRAILYFKAGCCVSSFCRGLDELFSTARDSLTAQRAGRETSGAFDRVGDRLRGLIKSEMERTIKNEWTSHRDLLLRSACFED